MTILLLPRVIKWLNFVYFFSIIYILSSCIHGFLVFLSKQIVFIATITNSLTTVAKATNTKIQDSLHIGLIFYLWDFVKYWWSVIGNAKEISFYLIKYTEYWKGNEFKTCHIPNIPPHESGKLNTRTHRCNCFVQ